MPCRATFQTSSGGCLRTVAAGSRLITPSGRPTPTPVSPPPLRGDDDEDDRIVRGELIMTASRPAILECQRRWLARPSQIRHFHTFLPPDDHTIRGVLEEMACGGGAWWRTKGVALSRAMARLRNGTMFTRDGRLERMGGGAGQCTVGLRVGVRPDGSHQHTGRRRGARD